MADRLEMLRKMTEGGSKDPFHWYALAMELRSHDRPEDALAAYGDVRDAFPDYVATYLMAGQVAHELEQTDVARGWLEAGLVVAAKAGEGKAQSELQQLLDML
ncbi:MAG: tetratricopeptide repeat protein [Deltaproteobacteria bacterium]|nr:MAG: tetratricopeptide repeat protein [Deltaproteobacteria bacterium]